MFIGRSEWNRKERSCYVCMCIHWQPFFSFSSYPAPDDVSRWTAYPIMMQLHSNHMSKHGEHTLANEQNEKDEEKKKRIPIAKMVTMIHKPRLPLFEPVFLSLVKQIRFRWSQIHDLWTSVSILFLNRTFLAVVGIRNTRTTTDHTSTLIRAIITLVTDTNQGTGTNVWVTDHTLAVTLFTQSSNRYSWLFSTKDQIRMMFSHFVWKIEMRLRWRGEPAVDENQTRNQRHQDQGSDPHLLHTVCRQT